MIPFFVFQKKNDFFELRSEVRLDDHLMEFGIFAFVQIDLSLAYVSSEGQRKDFLVVDIGDLLPVDGNVLFPFFLAPFVFLGFI